MHALRSMRTLFAGLGLASFMIGLAPGSAAALPLPGNRTPFRLFAKAISFINVNRVYMGVNNIGEVGVDSAGRGTVQGGYWPRGSADNYIFNSGLQVAGIIQGNLATNPWAGDTTGGWFFDGAGGRQQTEGLTQVYQAANPADLANWPSDAYVPQGDFVADLYAQPLQGLLSASQGDVHFVAWEGNPSFSSARKHPLGILADYRIMAWNYPAGAQDVVFLVATFYNITSAVQSDYAAHRCTPAPTNTAPCLRDLLYQQGLSFQKQNNAKFNITLPLGGYTIGPMFAAAAGDNDVGNDANNYNGVMLPFAMGYTYDATFGTGKAGWTFDPSIFTAPFFKGVGFVGYKYLKGPDGPGAIQLFSTFCNGAAVCGAGHADPASTVINYRLMAGTPAPTDGQCNIPGIPSVTHVCFMLLGSTATDTRMTESSTPMTLHPGEGKTIVIAYVFAPPVAIPGFVPGTVNVPPGDVTWSSSVDSMTKYNGLNRIDSLSGFVRYAGPATDPAGSCAPLPDPCKHAPVQSDFIVVKGSLLGKALVAQAVFDAQFLQEFAPDSPVFFLVPGDKQVTILWKPSATETGGGDPYFQVVGHPTNISKGQVIPNPLYDPNYRQFDVEGYRIYRGRSDSPSALKLLAQFDYSGTTFKDFTGAVYNGNCAPELGITTDCPIVFDTPVPGVAPTHFQTYNVGPGGTGSGLNGGIGSLSPGAPLRFVDAGAGTRIPLLGGATSISTVIDTAVSGGGEFPLLSDGGVPFIFIDKAGQPNCNLCGVNNGVNYFYAVTAFDVNAPGHGPTSLESAKNTKQVTPGALAANYVNTSTTATGIFGRHNVLVDPVAPTLDPVTGEFSKQFQPTDAITLSLSAFAPQIVSGASSFAIQFDSTVVNTWAAATSSVGETLKIHDWFSLINAAGVATKLSVPWTIVETSFTGPGATVPAFFNVLSVDSALIARYGGGAGYVVPAAYTVARMDGGYATGLQGRGCANSTGSGSNNLGNGTTRSLQCFYNGPRWFAGANESTPDPTTASPAVGQSGVTTFQPTVTYGNAGSLPGVVAVNEPDAYGYITGSQWRDLEFLISPFVGASDYKLYWGTAGAIDSVIDVVHDEPIPFNTGASNSWGVLNQAASNVTGTFDTRPELSASDFSCIRGIQNFTTATAKPACSTVVALATTAVPGPMIYTNGASANIKAPASSVAAANNGFGLYLKGRIFTFELTGGALPAAGTVWTLRDYVGAIYGGKGKTVGNDEGAYAFIPAAGRPATTPGTSAKYTYSVTNVLNAADSKSVAAVHTVPDPYYVTSAFDLAVDSKDIQFVNVPTGAIIRIYSSSGVLLRVLQNNTTTLGGIVHWNVRNRTNQFVASGVYFYNVEAGGVSHTGRMTIINYASTVQ